jgi:hypothetical protein
MSILHLIVPPSDRAIKLTAVALQRRGEGGPPRDADQLNAEPRMRACPLVLRILESGPSGSVAFGGDETAQQVWSDPRLQIYDCYMLALSGRLLPEEAERIGPF